MAFKVFALFTRLSARALMSLMLVAAAEIDCAGPTWPSLYQSYARAFLDNQIRVIDRDTGDRTTSEGQAYAMFFALVANDRARFDGLLRWTELNLAAGSGLPRFYRFSAPASGLFLSFLRNFWGT